MLQRVPLGRFVPRGPTLSALHSSTPLQVALSTTPLPPGRVLPIAHYPSPVLREQCSAVEDVTSVQQLVADLMETARFHDGLGLSAPQVGVPVRVFVMRESLLHGMSGRTRGRRRRGAKKRVARGWIGVVNPTLEFAEATKRVLGPEGCLSFPDLEDTFVYRRQRVCMEGWDAWGAKTRWDLVGLPAVVAQHEFDHLDGVLLPDRAAVDIDHDSDAAREAKLRYDKAVERHYGVADIPQQPTVLL